MTQNINEIFAKKLRFFMDLYGMNQKDLADRMRVSEASVSNWMKGIKFPRADKVDKLCSIFNCKRSDFVEESTSDVDSVVKQHIANYSHLPSEWQALIDELVKAAQEEPQDSDKIWAILGKISMILRS